MSYTIYFNELESKIEVVHIGTMTIHELQSSIPAVRSQCEKHNCWEILSDIRQVNYQISETEEFAIAQQLSEVYPPNTRLVILHSDEQLSIDRTRLLEQTARLHDILLHFVTDELEARMTFTKAKAVFDE